MARIREHGIARTKAERIEGASGLAAPIHAAGGDTIAALLIAGPSERIHGNSAATETLLKAAAAECTRLAGGGENSNQNIGTEQNT
jgi:DNA-binding IclR family transcriptional regulator